MWPSSPPSWSALLIAFLLSPSSNSDFPASSSCSFLPSPGSVDNSPLSVLTICSLLSFELSSVCMAPDESSFPSDSALTCPPPSELSVFSLSPMLSLEFSPSFSSLFPSATAGSCLLLERESWFCLESSPTSLDFASSLVGGDTSSLILLWSPVCFDLELFSTLTVSVLLSAITFSETDLSLWWTCPCSVKSLPSVWDTPSLIFTREASSLAAVPPSFISPPFVLDWERPSAVWTISSPIRAPSFWAIASPGLSTVDSSWVTSPLSWSAAPPLSPDCGRDLLPIPDPPLPLANCWFCSSSLALLSAPDPGLDLTSLDPGLLLGFW